MRVPSSPSSSIISVRGPSPAMTTSKPGLFDELPETSFAGDQDADFGVSSNMDVSTASVLERLRYLPYRVG